MPASFSQNLSINLKSLRLTAAFLLFPLFFFGQSLTGLWTGVFSNDSNTIRKDQSFEIALTEYRGKVSGYSRSEFIVNDTLYYILKRVKGTIEGDVCEVKDDEIISYNFPTRLDKGIKVTSTFYRNKNDSSWYLAGSWKTNQTKKYYAVTGKVDLQEEKDLNASKIFPHLEELRLADEVAFYKDRKIGPPIVKIVKPERLNSALALQARSLPVNTSVAVVPDKPVIQKSVPVTITESTTLITATIDVQKQGLVDSSTEKNVTLAKAVSPDKLPALKDPAINSIDPGRKDIALATQTHSMPRQPEDILSLSNKGKVIIRDDIPAGKQETKTEPVAKTKIQQNETPIKGIPATNNPESIDALQDHSIALTTAAVEKNVTRPDLPSEHIQTKPLAKNTTQQDPLLNKPREKSDPLTTTLTKTTAETKQPVPIDASQNNLTALDNPAAKKNEIKTAPLTKTVSKEELALIKTKQPATANQQTGVPEKPDTKSLPFATTKTSTDPIKSGNIPSTGKSNTVTTILPLAEKTEVKAETVAVVAAINKAVPDITLKAAMIGGRKSEFSQVVNFRSDSLELSLYDNGEIDGDTVSLFMNGEVIMARQGLKASAIKKTIFIPPGNEDFTLVLFAENLGKYPPNTGLLVVHDGNDIYNLRFSSDFEKNAGIVFKRKK